MCCVCVRGGYGCDVASVKCFVEYVKCVCLCCVVLLPTFLCVCVLGGVCCRWEEQ